MSEPEDLTTDANSDLGGISGLGPVRRRLLAEAGIHSPRELANLTLDQLVSITGMPNRLAKSLLEAVPHRLLRTNESDLTASSISDDVPLVAEPADAQLFSADELVSDSEEDTPVALGEDTTPLTKLERATQRAQTIIADASRRAEPGSKLSENLSRFARLTDQLPVRVRPETRNGVVRRITERVQMITDRLAELLLEKKPTRPISSKRAKRLEQRLKRTRDSIKRTLKSGTTR